MDGGVFALLVDNEQAATWAQSSTSCHFFCRFAHCARERDLLRAARARDWDDTKRTVAIYHMLVSQNHKSDAKKLTRETGVSPSGYLVPEAHEDLNVHR